jgi:ribonuclease Y
MIGHSAFLIAGLLVGILLGAAMIYFFRKQRLRRANLEAADMVEEATLEAKTRMEKLQEDFEDWREGQLEKFEADNAKFVTRNQEYTDRLQEKEDIFQDKVKLRQQLLDRKNSALQSKQAKLDNQQKKLHQQMDKAQALRTQLLEEVKAKSNVAAADLQAQISDRLINESKTRSQKMAQEIEQEAQATVEREAKRVLNLVLNRFARPYCPERGIGNIDLSSPDVKLRVFGKENMFLRKIEQICGVDIVFNEEYQSASVMGFDPVRRELGRLVLEGLTRERQVDERKIEQVHERVKRDLFKRILNDGNKVASELKLTNLHENVRSMLGALRYRYSFAQNQYFHVAEVGWLGGLISAELGLPAPSGRRSGVLHDIGKAMDHSKDGGHAVIGAEFIEANGEAPEIVHAVRAHHYDETPSTDLAFITIAADAISGARPGARRSTVDSYSQKMADLEKIGNSFPGVSATYILSAGREVRVMVDGQSVDDHKALELSKLIAQRIEEECSYPGLIKVTVVRETQAVEFAR